jgi:hypothetical protein
VSGVYREVVPNRRLVFGWAWLSTPGRESRVLIEPSGKGSDLTLERAGPAVGVVLTCGLVEELFMQEREAGGLARQRGSDLMPLPPIAAGGVRRPRFARRWMPSTARRRAGSSRRWCDFRATSILPRKRCTTASARRSNAGERRSRRNGLGVAADAASTLPGAAGAALLDAAREAFTRAFEVTACISAAVALAAAVPAAVMLRRVGMPPPTAPAQAGATLLG